jgi:predicted CXXCH cytochrome family protein
MKSFCLGLAFCLVLTFGAALPARAISIVAPQSGSVVGDARIFVSGRAGVDTLRVGLNSKALPEVKVANGVFSFAVTLSEGNNSLVLSSGPEFAHLSINYEAGKGTYVFHPGYAEGDCSECHPGGVGTVRMDAPSGLCHNCHDQKDTAAYLHGPVAAGRCEFCHDPHGSSEEAFLTRGGSALCGACHDQSGSKEHMKASMGKACTDCHDPHGSEKRFFLY